MTTTATLNGKTVTLGFRSNFVIDGGIVAAASLLELVQSAKPTEVDELRKVRTMALERRKYIVETKGKNWHQRDAKAKSVVLAIDTLGIKLVGKAPKAPAPATVSEADPSKYENMTPKALGALRRRTKNPTLAAAQDAAMATYFGDVGEAEPVPAPKGDMFELIRMAKKLGLDLNEFFAKV